MDRFCLIATLALFSTLPGCASSHSFLTGKSCAEQSACCGEAINECGQAARASETCEPLLLSEAACCGNGCGADAQEGCSGCTGEGGGRRHYITGLEGGFEHGKKNMALDGVGWVMGIPSKLLLWNTKVDSHSVSPETVEQLRKYLVSRGLADVKVRVNQYDPIGEWRRLRKNKAMHPGWRYTVGSLSLAKYTLTPGRLFGNDEYNPFTHSISLYSDRTSIALREGARAKQLVDSSYPGTWATSALLPGSPLWIDTPAIREVIGYAQQTGQRKLERESYLVLFPAFGARMGSSATFFLDASMGQATQAGFALIGHAVGRTMAFRVSEGPMEMVKSVYGIVKKRPPVDDVWSSQDEQTAELNNPLPVDDFELTLVPLDVIYDSLN